LREAGRGAGAFFEDDKLKSDLRAIRKEVTASGNVRFAADRGVNGHADRFWGLALALHAAKSEGSGVIRDASQIRLGGGPSNRPRFTPSRLA